MKKWRRVWSILMSPCRWLGKQVLIPPFRWLRNKLDGQKVLKEELRKFGSVLMGLGCAGPLINGKLEALPLLFVGLLLWIAGLLDDLPKEIDDVFDDG